MLDLNLQKKNWNDSKRFLKRISGFENAYNSENFKTGTRVLENMIITCEKNNLELILVTSPTYNEYNRFLDPKIKQFNDSVSKYLQVRHNIPHFNFMNSSNFGNTDFYNGDHLNISGSKKLSRIIDSCLEDNDSMNFQKK